MNETDLAFASIEQIGKLFRTRKLSPVELTKLMLTRIYQLNPKLNAFITVTADFALAQAQKAESELFAPRGRKGLRDRGPLHGIPISLKDNIYTKDIRTTAGSKILKDFIPQRDATVVAQLKEAGAILLGKTNMHEFAYGVTTNNPHYGPAHNPWDLSRIPGGSSGGSAAAVAAGLCYGSIGTDTGGSIRIPAAVCGIVGFKPMRGQVSDDGVIPLSPTLDCTGPIARSIRDVTVLLHAVAQPMVLPHGPWSARRIFSSTREFRVGIPEEFFFDALSSEMRAFFDAALRIFRKLGMQAKKVSIPLLKETEDAGNQIAWPEATHYHQYSGFFPARSAEYGEDVRSRLEMGAKVLATDYLKALDQRVQFIHQFVAIMSDEKLDALLVPTTAIPAPVIGEEKMSLEGKEYAARALLLRNNRPANLANVPAISLPCGLTDSGLPVAIQLIGAHVTQLKLLNIAHAFERSCPPLPRPPL
ncbi:MAG TPA: amidase [Candidatus Acidoferrum sp.]|nr:amidase [Candidatus Acidoferrum sp.]